MTTLRLLRSTGGRYFVAVVLVAGATLERLIPRSGTEQPTWNLIMAGAMMALLPPVTIIVFMQRWFVKGLVESEK